jgi:hypothetical protein
MRIMLITTIENTQGEQIRRLLTCDNSDDLAIYKSLPKLVYDLRAQPTLVDNVEVKDTIVGILVVRNKRYDGVDSNTLYRHSGKLEAGEDRIRSSNHGYFPTATEPVCGEMARPFEKEETAVCAALDFHLE